MNKTNIILTIGFVVLVGINVSNILSHNINNNKMFSCKDNKIYNSCSSNEEIWLCKKTNYEYEIYELDECEEHTDD